MRIAIGNDHSSVELKKTLQAYMEELGHEVLNIGTDQAESVDYPRYGYRVATMVRDHEVDAGVLLCGTGVGISLAANKVKGVRACVCSEPYSARMSKQHNNTNVLAMGARVVGDELAKDILRAWLDAEFEGGRHARRVGLIDTIDACGALEEEGSGCC